MINSDVKKKLNTLPVQKSKQAMMVSRSSLNVRKALEERQHLTVSGVTDTSAAAAAAGRLHLPKALRQPPRLKPLVLLGGRGGEQLVAGALLCHLSPASLQIGALGFHDLAQVVRAQLSHRRRPLTPVPPSSPALPSGR